jgi:putative intracellular protease/amidase
VISRWPDAEVHFVARSLDPVRCDHGLTVIPTDTPDTLPNPDLIVVPGSQNPVPVLSDEVLLEWLRAAAPGSQWTASVCTGAGLYAAAGLLERAASEQAGVGGACRRNRGTAPDQAPGTYTVPYRAQRRPSGSSDSATGGTPATSRGTPGGRPGRLLQQRRTT